MKAKRQKKNQDQTRPNKPQNPRLSFMAHLMELRKRLFYIALSVVLWGTGAYFIQQQIVAALLRPAHNQQFIYTSVGGGIDFLFRVCIYAGIAASIPVIVFQILKYLQPLIKKDAVRFIAGGSVVSGILAAAGVAFGYFLGLPAALHFLLHQFTSDQIHPLLTIQSYMSFVTLYMLGSALLFQLPLILVLINRIKPLKPKKLLGYERWVVLLAFVGGGVMNPSPRVQDQLMLAVPMIAAYQVGIVLVWFMNRNGRSETIAELLRKDMEVQAGRQMQFREAQAALRQKMAGMGIGVGTETAVAATGAPAPRTAVVAPAQVPPPRAKPARPMPAALSAVRPGPNPIPKDRATQPTQMRPRAMAGTARRAYFNDFAARRPAGRPAASPIMQQDTSQAQPEAA